MIFILLPIYNEAQNLDALIGKVKKGMERHGYSYKIIAYNDGSTDNSLELLRKNQTSAPLHIIGKAQNEGLGFAFLSLLKEAVKLSESDDDISVVLDSDCTHNPEHIYHMVSKVRDGFDLVIASRYLPDSRIVGVSRFREFLSLGASWMMRFLFPIKGVKDYTCGYRAYSNSLLKRAFDKYGEKLVEETGFACMAELLIKLSYMNILSIEIPLVLRYDQKGGESKMNIVKTIKRTLLLIVKLKRINRCAPAR